MELGGLRSMGSLRIGHDWATSLSLFTLMHWRRKWQLPPVFLPGESQGRGSLVGCCLWGHTESDTTKVTAAAAASRGNWSLFFFFNEITNWILHNWLSIPEKLFCFQIGYFFLSFVIQYKIFSPKSKVSFIKYNWNIFIRSNLKFCLAIYLWFNGN